MRETINLEVNLRAFVRRESKKRFIAVCPKLGVVSQGATEDAAKRAVEEAVELWFESCLERGVLDQALREVNFKPLPAGEEPPDGVEHVFVTVTSTEEEDVLGSDFNIHVSIPAYQAAAFLSAGM